jgi:hypothetical protein
MIPNSTAGSFGMDAISTRVHGDTTLSPARERTRSRVRRSKR